MIFRPKFAWLQLALAILWIGMSYRWLYGHPYNETGYFYLIIAIAQCVSALIVVSSHWLVWWKVEESGLSQRRFWNMRTVPWNDINRIGPWQPNSKVIPFWVAVSYARSAPMSDHGELLFQPADRDALIRSLRAHAPQADFEIFS